MNCVNNQSINDDNFVDPENSGGLPSLEQVDANTLNYVSDSSRVCLPCTQMGFHVERKNKEQKWVQINLTNEKLPVNWKHYNKHMKPSQVVFILNDDTQIKITEHYFNYILE